MLTVVARRRASELVDRLIRGLLKGLLVVLLWLFSWLPYLVQCEALPVFALPVRGWSVLEQGEEPRPEMK